VTHANDIGAGVSAPAGLKVLPDAEQLLEQQIKAASDRMCAEPDRTLKLQYWREMCRLIDRRSPEQIAKMEAGIRG
jgi:hypothetical protein